MSIMKKPFYEIIEIFKQDFIQMEDIKNYLKVSYKDDDYLINQLIESAIESCENYTGLTLFPKKIRYSISNYRSNQIHLSDNPIKEIIEIKQIFCEKEELITENLFKVNAKEGFIKFKEYLGEVAITYIAGFQDNKSIPRSLIQGMRMHIAQMYDSGTYRAISEDLQKLYQPYKRINI